MYSMGSKKDTTQRTTIILDPQLHTRVRILAIERHTTFTALLTEALTEYLERETRKQKGKR